MLKKIVNPRNFLKIKNSFGKTIKLTSTVNNKIIFTCNKRSFSINLKTRSNETGGIKIDEVTDEKEEKQTTKEKKVDPVKDDDVVEEDEEKSKEEEEEIRTEGLIKETETLTGKKSINTFKAETRQLLDIVATALYTDKEVFIRELISNASDALEKVRELSLTSESKIEDPNIPLDINISVDDKLRTFTIQDSGIGMSEEELKQNIGTICHSGSKQFVKQLQKGGDEKDAISNIIGQFGVGFYSIFMVADKVRVYSRSALKGGKGLCWESFGGEEFTITEANGVARGTKIILTLKDSDKEFSIRETVERIIKKYSNFVSFEIKLNGSIVNTQQALWLQPKNSVTPEQHKEFFKYLTHSSNTPMYTIHFSTDIPLNIHALFYVPDSHGEKFGMGKQEPGVNVYCKKVLIQAKHRDILPDWLRWIKGAVDSEDLPLHISREHLQNSPLIRRINGILTRKILRYLEDMLKQDLKKYIKFYEEFNKFLKEGLSSDILYKDDIAKLLLFESSKLDKNEQTTLSEYVARMPSDQNDIYYLIAPNRDMALSSPYFEVFKKKGIEVLFLYNSVDEFVMGSLSSFKKKNIKSCERTDIPAEKSEPQSGLSKTQVKELEKWWVSCMKGRVSSVTSTKRLSGTPAIVFQPENSAMRAMRKMYNQAEVLPAQKLEVDPSHETILKLYRLAIVDGNLSLGRTVAEQIYYNSLISAGLVDDPREMLTTLNNLLNTATRDVPLPETKVSELEEEKK